MPPLSCHCPFAGVGEPNGKRNLTFWECNQISVFNDTNCLVTYVLIPDFDKRLETCREASDVVTLMCSMI